jgi:hypothetical protein
VGPLRETAIGAVLDSSIPLSFYTCNFIVDMLEDITRLYTLHRFCVCGVCGAACTGM